MPFYDVRWLATPSAAIRDGDWKLIESFGDSIDEATHRLVRAAWPNEVMGLLPAAFAIPPLLGLIILLKRPELKDKPQRLAQLAWFGAAALFFVTSIVVTFASYARDASNAFTNSAARSMLG